MDSSLALFTLSALEQRLKSELSACNGMTGKYGLSLSESAVLAIAQKRSETLLETGRVEFGESVVPKLIEAFCDSPYLLQDDYEETLCALTEAFYSFKNDCFGRLTDDELIKCLRACYDAYEGGLDTVCSLTIDELRRGRRVDDADAADDEERADE